MLKKKKTIPYSLLLIFFVVDSLWYIFSSPHVFSYQFLGSADYISPIQIITNIVTHFFVYDPYIYGGINSAYLIAHLFPEYALFYFGNFLPISPLFISLFYIAIILFLAQFAMYEYLSYIAITKLHKFSIKIQLLIVPFAIIYAFSPAFATLVPPGHFIQAFPYILFPLLLKELDILFVNDNSGKKPYIIIYFIFLSSATAFGNVGVVYTILLTLFIYIFLTWFIQRITFSVVVKKTVVILFLLAFANIWWVLPYATTLHDLVGADPQNYYINTAIDSAVQKASVLNIFLGKADDQLYLLGNTYYINTIAFIAFAIIAIYFIIALVNVIRNKYITILAFLSLVGIFITKGPREPFSDIFLWLYNHIISFQSFRRPVSKYWGIFIIFYLTLSFIGAVIISKRMSKMKYIFFSFIPFFFIAGYYMFAFFNSTFLTPFTIPSYYYTARDDLQKSQANKILLLPGTYGIQPIFNKSINNLYASDFLYYIWDYALVAPDASDSTPNEPQKKQVNHLVDKLFANKNVCTQFKKLGISHIMVREDLSPQQKTEEGIGKIHSILDKNQIIASKKIYSDKNNRGFTLYTLQNNCRSNIITLYDNFHAKVSMQFSIQNPTKINIEIKNIKTKEELYFLNNFNPAWKLYPSKLSSDFIENATKNKNSFLNKIDIFSPSDLSYLWEKSLPEKNHSIGYDYANKWIIDPTEVKKDYPYYFTSNKDGSINVQLVLYYQKQTSVVYGFLLFVSSILGGISYLLIISRKNLSKRL